MSEELRVAENKQSSKRWLKTGDTIEVSGRVVRVGQIRKGQVCLSTTDDGVVFVDQKRSERDD